MDAIDAQRYDRGMWLAERASLRRLRRLVLAEARGAVLEIGAGTGANLPLYDPGLRVTAVELRPEDPVLGHLWSVDPIPRATRLRRLRVALESFDQALISTIHGFCQRMLQQNAFESGVAFDLELTPDTDALAPPM